MAVTIQQISPVAHLPLVLGVIRKLNVAALIDTFCPPHPAHVLSCGRGVDALLLPILLRPHALYTVGGRLEERGMLPLLQPGLTRASLHDYRLGQILEALFAAHLNRVFGAIALNALEVYALSTPWLHQDTTTITLYGAYEEEARPGAEPIPPRPAYGHSKDGRASITGSATLCASRWTQRRGRQLHRLQYRCEHRARLLTEKALRSRRSVRPREEKVVNRGEALPLARQIESSKLMAA